MGPQHDPRSTVADLQLYLFGITFPIACVLCIAILVQRIRRRRAWGGRITPAAPKRQMDSNPNPPNNVGGKERADLVVGRQAATTHPPAPRDGAQSLPSACDILQPLSHLTALPSSGYLAAVLGRERRARATAVAAPAYLAASGGVLGPVDPPAHANANGVPGRGGGGAQAIEPAWSDPDRTLPPSGPASPQRRGSSDESCAELDDPQSRAVSPTGWRRERPGSAAGEPQPVQKRSQTVQHLYGVDEEGARAWRRVMMEYS